MHLIVFCANHSVLRKSFIDSGIAAGSPAPLYVITHLAPKFERATIILEHGFNKGLLESLDLPVSVKVVKGSRNKIISLFWQFLYGAMFSIKNIKQTKVYYGYGYNSVVSYYLSRIFQGISVARFYGTFLGRHVTEGKISLKGMSPKRLWELFAFSRQHDLLVCTNDGTDSFSASEAIHRNKERVKIILNGLDVPKNIDYSLPVYIEKNQYRFVSVSRLANWKRIDLCLKFYAGFVKKYPEAATSLVVVGDGEALEELKEYANKLGISEKVFFTGGLSREEIFSIVGNTLIEALHVGLIPVLRNTGVTGRVMTEGVNAYFLPGPEDEMLERMGECYAKIRNGGQGIILDGVSNFSREKIFSWDKRIESEYQMIIRVKNRK
jgi:glycosyltransferase involved in cell wall biosynthesis